MVNFTTVSATEVQRASTTRSTKYDALRDACLTLEPGQAICIDPEAGEDLDGFRTNISNAVRVRTNSAFEAKGLNQKIRIVKTDDARVAVVCYVPEPKKEKNEAGDGAPKKPVLKRPKVAAGKK